MLCLLVGKQSTYFTVSPVTGAGVTRRYWILVAGALGSGRLSPAWHSCGLLGGAPLLPRCALQGGQPRVRLVWRTPGPHRGGRDPSPLPEALPASPPHTSFFPRGLFPGPQGTCLPIQRKKIHFFPEGNSWLALKSTGQEVLSEV